MDDTAQIKPVATTTKDDTDKIITGVNHIPVASSLNKEAGITRSEIIKPSEPEIRVGQDVQNAGVSAHSDKPKLDEIHEQIGVSASLESTPVKTSPTGNVVLPMTEDEADKIVNTKQSKFNLHENVGEFAGEYTEDSLPFFATLIKKIFKEMHKKIVRKNS